MSTTMFQMRPRDVRKSVIECMQVNLVPFITSSPGLGKSSIVAQIADDFSLEIIDLRLSQCAPEDLMGLPMRIGEGKDMRASFVPFKMFPTEGDPLPEGKKGWILLLDEFNSSAKSVQAAAYKLVLDRMVGQANLHENVFVVCAGNLASDRAIVNSLSTAMQSRLIHIEMLAHHEDFMDHATKAEFDHRILGFLEFQPSKLHDFKPDHNDRTFACPRTWEFASRLIKGKAIEAINLPLLAGTLSDGVAVEFHTFLKEYEKIPSFSAICKDPEGLEVPYESSTRYAITTMLMDRFTNESFEDVVKYMKRMSPEFQVIYFRGIRKRQPHMAKDPAYAKSILHLMKFLNDEDDEDDKEPARSAAA